MYQANIATRHILGDEDMEAEYHAVPRVTFTDPEIGAVGLTQAQAADQGLDVATATVAVPSSARGWIHKAGNEGLIKLAADRNRGIPSAPPQPDRPAGEYCPCSRRPSTSAPGSNDSKR